MLTLPFQILTQLCFNENEADVEIVTLPSEDENELAEISEVFPKNERASFDNDNKHTLKSFFAFSSFFFFYKGQRRKDGNDFEADTVSGFQNPPELKRDKTYSALSFDRITFPNMANLFTLFRKPVVMCYCFLEPIKLSFLTPVKLLSNHVSCSCFRSPKLEEAI